MHPFRGTALEQLEQLSLSASLRARMNRICTRSLRRRQFPGCALILFWRVMARRGMARVFPRKAKRDQGAAFFGAEDTMMIGAYVGHALNSAVPQDSAVIRRLDPAINCRAIVRLSLRDEAGNRSQGSKATIR